MLLLLLFAIAVGGCTSNASTSIVPTGQIGFTVGDTAPDFTVNDVDGRSFTLSEVNGKPVVIAFFATWCAPCQIEAATLKKLDDEQGGNTFEVLQIGVDQRESIDDLKRFKDSFGNEDWIVGFGFDTAEKYGVRSLDTTVIVKDGVIVYRDNGVPARLETLRKWLP